MIRRFGLQVGFDERSEAELRVGHRSEHRGVGSIAGRPKDPPVTSLNPIRTTGTKLQENCRRKDLAVSRPYVAICGCFSLIIDALL